jgi:6-phosphogluconolactonase
VFASDPACWVYFGTQETGPKRGIYRSSLDEATGELSPAVRVTEKSDSVFMAFSPDHKFLYGLSEVPGPGRQPREAIETYSADPATGALANVGEQVSQGSEACHISVDPSGRCVLTANYDGHYVEVFPIRPDHTVGPRTCDVYHSGSGPNLARQESAHPHSINVDPSDRFAIVADLGMDTLTVYRLDPARAKLLPHPSVTRIDPGSGPRHLAFHPDGRHAFVINEIVGTITAMNWDGEKGTLTPYQTISILRSDFKGENRAAEVVVSKDGRYVYGSNRGDDSLVVLAFDVATGRLSFVQRMHDGVKVPRNYSIDPSGNWLVCANLEGGTATIYRIDRNSGKLRLTGSIGVPQALCVRFLQAR